LERSSCLVFELILRLKRFAATCRLPKRTTLLLRMISRKYSLFSKIVMIMVTGSPELGRMFEKLGLA